MCVKHVCVHSVILKVVCVRPTFASGKNGERSVRRATSGENLVEARGDTDVRIVRYAWTKLRKFN